MLVTATGAAEKAPTGLVPRAFWNRFVTRAGTPFTDVVTLHIPTMGLPDVHCIVASGENDGE